MKYEEIIDKYLRGLMTSEEEKAFMEKCKTNKELKEEAVMIAYLAKSVRSISRPY